MAKTVSAVANPLEWSRFYLRTILARQPFPADIEHLAATLQLMASRGAEDERERCGAIANAAAQSPHASPDGRQVAISIRDKIEGGEETLGLLENCSGTRGWNIEADRLSRKVRAAITSGEGPAESEYVVVPRHANADMCKAIYDAVNTPAHPQFGETWTAADVWRAAVAAAALKGKG